MSDFKLSEKILFFETDTILYKIVSITPHRKYISLHEPITRVDIPGYQYKGIVQTFQIGNTYESSLDSTPGFFCYLTVRDAILQFPIDKEEDCYILKILGKRLVKYRVGYHNGSTIYGVEQIEIYPPIYSSFRTQKKY